MKKERKLAKKAVMLWAAVIAAMILMVMVNVIVTKSAYQCSMCLVILAVGMVELLNGERTRKTLCLSCVCIFAGVLLYIGCFPSYSVKAAKELIQEQERAITQLNYEGNLDPVKRTNKICETKDYIFSYGNPKKRILFQQTGTYRYVDW
ncbi:MAG: hypothetical protein ACI4HI_14970 [Lachnospiraceae bacterium]